MKTLYAICFVLIGVLVLAAFNPEEVVRTAHKVKIKYIETPKKIAEQQARLDLALAGDAEAQFRVGQILTFKIKRDRKQPVEREIVYGHLSSADGERMIRDAAAQGHPDAMYWVWKNDGGNEIEDADGFMELVKAGSWRARSTVQSTYYRNPCDTSMDDHMKVLRDMYSDPTSVYYSHVKDMKRSMVDDVVASFDAEWTKIQEMRKTGCAAG